TRTATINRIRGLLSEFGVVLPQKAEVVRREAGRHLEDLPGWANTAIGDSLSELHHLDERIAEYDRHIEVMAKADERGCKLMDMPGIGAKTASALLASIGNGHDFKCGRQLAAWLGLVPGQYSSGGKQRLGRITKAGDSYLRTLLILGARAVVAASKNKTDRLSRWAQSVAERRGYWKAVVARNATRYDGFYRPSKAQVYAIGRRRRCRRRSRYTVADWVWTDTLLWTKWSPELIARTLGLTGEMSICHETIYRRIRRDRLMGGHLWLYTRIMSKFARKRYRGRSTRGILAGKRHISARPKEVEGRQRLGHWEG